MCLRFPEALRYLVQEVAHQRAFARVHVPGDHQREVRQGRPAGCSGGGSRGDVGLVVVRQRRRRHEELRRGRRRAVATDGRVCLPHQPHGTHVQRRHRRRGSTCGRERLLWPLAWTGGSTLAARHPSSCPAFPRRRLGRRHRSGCGGNSFLPLGEEVIDRPLDVAIVRVQHLQDAGLTDPTDHPTSRRSHFHGAE
jgi:hypothetical protein